MIRINLLPHREERREARRRQFYVFSVLTVILSVIIVLFVYTIIEGYIEAQEAKNSYLKKEIAELDKQIEEIKALQAQTQALLARKQVIESLQQDRAEAVYLLSELVKQMPEGVYLRSVKQSGTKVALIGYAQSNARVSTLMRNIEASEWMERPELIEIKAVTVERRRLNEFNLNASMKRSQNQDENQSQEANNK